MGTEEGRGKEKMMKFLWALLGEDGDKKKGTGDMEGSEGPRVR